MDDVTEREVVVPRMFVRALLPNAVGCVIEHCRLEKVDMSKAIYIGDCPLCGSHRSFFVKREARRAFCCECGANIAFR